MAGPTTPPNCNVYVHYPRAIPYQITLNPPINYLCVSRIIIHGYILAILPLLQPPGAGFANPSGNVRGMSTFLNFNNGHSQKVYSYLAVAAVSV